MRPLRAGRCAGLGHKRHGPRGAEREAATALPPLLPGPHESKGRFLTQPPTHTAGRGTSHRPHPSRSPGTSSCPRHPCRRRTVRRWAGHGSAAPSARTRGTRGPASPPRPWCPRDAAVRDPGSASPRAVAGRSPGSVSPLAGRRTSAPFPAFSAVAVGRGGFE